MANKLSQTNIDEKYESIRNIVIFKTYIICLFKFFTTNIL
jgi:hypothetical protein